MNKAMLVLVPLEWVMLAVGESDVRMWVGLVNTSVIIAYRLFIN